MGFTLLINYSTSGANEIIFIYPLSRSSLATGPAFASAEDIDEVRPHGFTPSEQSNAMHIPRANRREMTASSPEEAQKMADTMKAGLDAQHQKYTHRQDGFTHTIVVE